MIYDLAQAKAHFGKHNIKPNKDFIAVLPDGHILSGDKDHAQVWVDNNDTIFFIKGSLEKTKRKKQTE